MSDSGKEQRTTRGYRRRVIRSVRRRLQSQEAAAATAAPGARELFERRHAVLEVTVGPRGTLPTVDYRRACTCPIGAPHTPDGKRVRLDVTDGARR
jgi:hypothetical protein